MQVHCNRLLFDLSQENAQRLRLAELFRVSGPAVHGLWSNKTLAFHRETPSVIAAAYHRCAEVHRHPDISPGSSERIFRTSSSTQARTWLVSELQALSDDEYVASFGGSSELTFASVRVWIPDLPVTRVTGAEVGAVFQAEEGLPFEELALVSLSSNAGLVLDSYAGFLPDEFGPSKVVYELAAWTSDS